jgi:hypothetical protein
MQLFCCKIVEFMIEKEKKVLGSGGIRTHASEETGALNQRLRPLGHATHGTFLEFTTSIHNMCLFIKNFQI